MIQKREADINRLIESERASLTEQAEKLVQECEELRAKLGNRFNEIYKEAEEKFREETTQRMEGAEMDPDYLKKEKILEQLEKGFAADRKYLVDNINDPDFDLIFQHSPDGLNRMWIDDTKEVLKRITAATK